MSALLTYVVGCVGLIVKPGPDLLCTVATALSYGRRRALCLMCGLILGCWFWILLLALGAAAFFQSHPAVMAVVRYGGMAYIAYLAAECLHEAWVGFRGRAGLTLVSPKERGLRLVGRGVALSMSNPLTIIFFLAFLPHFTTADATLSPSVQVLLLGTLFCCLVPFIYVPIIWMAGALKETLERRPGFAPSIKLVSGGMLLAVVVLLALG